MKKQYDFSKGKKGVFFIEDKKDIHLPIYLDNDIEEYFSKIASSKGKDLNSIINKVLKKEVELQKELSI
ncbi:toxin-antitoxin system, antitoxin component [Leptospira sp. 201903071]|uniref:toxin-antitoxin system, antitoxin component n=1 Tax=Leptospira ainazelensis TaxID=2810034 RepID=UPI001966AC7F|nr:toxin-antitoxin system, antitoxin component [Leptospira ainazelensis]MBM9501235.1 toxin-antitoxin system, antitoxin component [Leptospira ainazelensis]